MKINQRLTLGKKVKVKGVIYTVVFTDVDSLNMYERFWLAPTLHSEIEYYADINLRTLEVSKIKQYDPLNYKGLIPDIGDAFEAVNTSKNCKQHYHDTVQS